jgi:predicted amidohydrolase
MVLLSPSGEFSAPYAKNHPVPPYEPLPQGAGVYPVFDTSFGKMAAMICQDTNFTDVSRKLAINGAQLIADGLNEYRGDAEQKVTYVTFRAVENHTALVATGSAHSPPSLTRMAASSKGRNQMNKLKLFFGILSLVATLGLVYANLTLPPESLLFDIGYGNMPWAPPIIFGIVGIVLLATAGIGRPSVVNPETQVIEDPEKAALNKRLENIALGCFLVMWGGAMFWSVIAPNSAVREGVWSIAVGLIFLGLNAARYINKIRMSGFTTFLGLLSVVGGVVQLLGVHGLRAHSCHHPGAYLVLKPWFDRQKLFGKARKIELFG